MANLIVNHAKLAHAAGSVDSYIDTLNNRMHKMDVVMNALKVGWEGKDYDQLLIKWEEMRSKKSITAKYISELSSYSEALQDARKKYINAQARAINRAASNCK